MATFRSLRPQIQDPESGPLDSADGTDTLAKIRALRSTDWQTTFATLSPKVSALA